MGPVIRSNTAGACSKKMSALKWCSETFKPASVITSLTYAHKRVVTWRARGPRRHTFERVRGSDGLQGAEVFPDAVPQ